MARKVRGLSSIRAAYSGQRAGYEAVLSDFSQKVQTLLASEGLYPLVTHRVKELDSYLEKRARLRRSQPRGPILLRDLFGMRVVCPFLDETHHVLALLAANFDVAEVEHKGANRPLAEFGYESVHLSVRLPKGTVSTLLPHTKPLCEVQVRTILQHAWAQIEHEMVYKADHSVPKTAIRRKLAAVSATLTLADVVFQETRDALAERHEQGVRRRESPQSLPNGEEMEPLSASPREVSQHAKRDRAATDPRSRDPESLIVQALGAHSDGDLEEAVGLYSEVLRLRLPNAVVRSMIYNHRGIAHLVLARPIRAVRDFKSAVRWNGENYRAYFNRGLAHRNLGNSASALRDFGRAVGSSEVEGDARYAMAQVLADQGKRREARVEFDKALALKPNLPGAHALSETLRED